MPIKDDIKFLRALLAERDALANARQQVMAFIEALKVEKSRYIVLGQVAKNRIPVTMPRKEVLAVLKLQLRKYHQQVQALDRVIKHTASRGRTFANNEGVEIPNTSE